MRATNVFSSVIDGLTLDQEWHHFSAETFPTLYPIHWLTSHFAVGGWSPLQRLSGMLTAHMSQVAPHNGFTWHPHRGLEIFTYVIEGELYHEDTTGGSGTISAGEVQRMFSGDFIQHQELNLSDNYARVIQIWFVADPKYRDLAPNYEQIGLQDMASRQIGDATVRDIIGPNGATDSHVNARLSSTVVPVGGSTTIELPEADEDLFLYVVDGLGRVQASTVDNALNLYDVVVATPSAETITLSAEAEPLTFLSFYLPSFMQLGRNPLPVAR